MTLLNDIRAQLQQGFFKPVASTAKFRIEYLHEWDNYMKTSLPATALLQGTLDVLILKVLALEPLHGLGVSRRIAQVTGNTFQVKPGSLFPALHRMEEAGWLSSSWGESENTRRAKFYRLTKAGTRQLKEETAQWTRISAAIASALEMS